jgi:hypothetical protein
MGHGLGMRIGGSAHVINVLTRAQERYTSSLDGI